MLRIDQLAHANRLRSVHPAEKFAFAILTLVFCLVASRPLISLVIILFMGAGIVLLAGIPLKFYLKLMLIPTVFLLIGVFTVIFQISQSPFPSLWGFSAWGVNLGITAAGLEFAGSLVLKSLGAVSCLYFLALTTPMTELMWVLKKARVPGLFLELMMIIYRFVFVLLETTSSIYVSQESRWGYATIKNSYLSLGWLTANLFIKSYHHAQQLFAALLARCYQEELKVLEMTYSFSKKNITLIALFGLTLLVLVCI